MNILCAYENVDEIRFLPNSKDVFPSYNDFTNFIKQTLVKRNGRYNYPGHAMRSANNTLVFLQYDGKLVASSILLDTIRGKCCDEVGNIYAGHYIFDMDTMVIYNSPITREQIEGIYNEFNGFSQCKQQLDISLLEKLLKIVKTNGYEKVI